MTPRHALLAAALLGAAALAVFGDTTPDGGVAEASRRAPAAGAAPVSVPRSEAGQAPASSSMAPAGTAGVAPPSAVSPSPQTVAAPGRAPLPPVRILRLLPREQVAGAPDEEGFAGDDSLFGSQRPLAASPPQARQLQQTPPTLPPPPPPPPQAPPLPFTYLGKAATGGAWEVFLARADQTYLVRASMVLDGLYRVDTVAPPMLTLTYLPLNQVQQLDIGAPD